MISKFANGTIFVPPNSPIVPTMHVHGTVFVPIAFELNVLADTSEQACQAFASAVAGGLHGRFLWNLRSPALVYQVTRSDGVKIAVPKRFSLLEWTGTR